MPASNVHIIMLKRFIEIPVLQSLPVLYYGTINNAFTSLIFRGSPPGRKSSQLSASGCESRQ